MAVSRWRPVSVRDVIAVIRNGTTEQQVTGPTEFPVSRIETIADGIIDWGRVGYLAKNAPTFELRCGDVLYSHINSVAHIGKVAVVKDDRPLYHGMNLMLLRFDNSKVLPQFCFRVLQSSCARAHARREAKSAINQASLGQDQILCFWFDLPPIGEQRRIEEILDTLDKAIRRTEQVIEKLQQMKQGLLHDLLTRGIDDNGELRPPPEEAPHLYRNSPLGLIPRSWDVSTVDEIGPIFTGTTPDKTVESFYGGDELFVSPPDITTWRWIECTQKTLSKRGLRQARELPELSVMVTCIGGLGRVGQSRQRVATNQQINSIVAGIRVDPGFLYYAAHLLRPQLEIVAGLQVIPIVNKSQFSKLLLPRPPLKEQINIRERFEVLESLLASEVGCANKLRIMKKGLMNDLLTGRVRVNVPEGEC